MTVGHREGARVGILFGSESDREIMAEAGRVLDRFGVAHEMNAMSAHRSPEAVVTYVRSARSRGIRVLVCGAGMAAHLAGVAASQTTLPVLGVPLPGGIANGLDALLSTVMMPAGVAVGTLAVGKAGARNAGLLAVQILALSDAGLERQLAELKDALARGESL